jgi:hypothetical protein
VNAGTLSETGVEHNDKINFERIKFYMFNIIFKKEDLHGTCYFELMPGKYQGQCWNDGSIFLTERNLGFLIPSIKKAFEKFDYYSFHGINKKTWKQIIENLKETKNVLLTANEIKDIENHIEFILITKEKFQDDFKNNINKLVQFIDEFQNWIIEKLTTNNVISILGI